MGVTHTHSLSGKLMDFEEVFVFEDQKLGMTAIIAIHDTTLGPSLGGCRRMQYSTFMDALTDVTRLARGMTNKSALAGLPLGGGKCVLIPHKGAKRLRKAQYHALGRFIDSVGGRYITAEDVGTGVGDIKEVHKHTQHVVGQMKDHPHGGDPSPMTATGVYYGMLGAVRAIHGASATLEGRSVYVEGLGKVGFALLHLLHRAGARLWVSNLERTSAEKEVLRQARERFGATVVELSSAGEPIAFPYVEIYAPCALGGIVNTRRIYHYPFCLKLIAGSANNVLLDPETDGTLLLARDIAYAPDYVINNGGIRDVYYQLLHERGECTYDHDQVAQLCMENESLVRAIITRASAEKKPSHVIADCMAQEVLDRKRFGV